MIEAEEVAEVAKTAKAENDSALFEEDPGSEYVRQEIEEEEEVPLVVPGGLKRLFTP